MKFFNTTLQDVFLIKPAIFHDSRGHFFESFNAESWKKQGFTNEFVQDNQSFSKKGVVRGLHFQHAPYAQGKLVRVMAGRVLDIALDLRADSPTFGKYELFDLDAANGDMVYIPEGFAHGFAALEDSIFHYKCTGPYHKDSEGGLHWNDPFLNIPWGLKDPIVSEKDQILPTFSELYNKSLRSL
ncbi:dTDP-4-dehydrorhamnose 3,5-epimerase [Dyadobacter sp. LJ53]|uniref:dTDP-4-dehydrorhamnose 3,5-epimerase n=1 Tax=Dyadobacter chenwenxiniae TaxID=2906456 RepID=UPI001F32CF4B|nr:dTDP-4-dehydrorhamnose 3,5-epimerase [Dyadobacter chenwenxiniae]MCF0048430.1 dTDP-4-dehydrorhamnose 3,5-epimerase [Dyadobacter chenwenxiniae]